MKETLAVKYRPKTFDDVIGQDIIVKILKSQIESNSFKNAYLFCGPAGDGKTTVGRIFANEINKGQGSPLEIDAASHNGVADVREIISQAQTQSITSEYRVMIVDEVHQISTQGWQAFLKTLEDAPKTAVFIFCTTNPEKIPTTILSRVQRFDFRRISVSDISNRLKYILESENIDTYTDSAVDYIAKQADGGMRSAITYLDRCLAYSSDINLDNVISTLGTYHVDDMFDLTLDIALSDFKKIVCMIDDLYNSGADLKNFIRQYLSFVINVRKLCVFDDIEYTTLPNTDDVMHKYNALKDEFESANSFYKFLGNLSRILLEVNFEIRYDSAPKQIIECELLQEVRR